MKRLAIVGDLVIVSVDVPDGVPDFTFMALVVSIGPFFIEVYCPADCKSYTVSPLWCETL